MPNKKGTKKASFSLAPITLSEPIKTTDGFTNLVETDVDRANSTTDAAPKKNTAVKKRTAAKDEVSELKTPTKPEMSVEKTANHASEKRVDDLTETADEPENNAETAHNLSESELLRILDADSIDEIYELTDVLRASSLKLYAALRRIADSRGRARAKNHELMSQAGIKGIATLYKQERWLMDLKLLEKKAKPGPHDGSSYVVFPLESLPLPDEIYEKFQNYLSETK